jgi:hypothetical protein
MFAGVDESISGVISAVISVVISVETSAAFDTLGL